MAELDKILYATCDIFNQFFIQIFIGTSSQVKILQLNPN
jgi:hypothetical protein